MSPAQGRRCARRGITLLEVLISTGVLAIGVMSIASLLPVGRLQMSQASALDHASAVGRAAFRDMEVHGYLRPSTWLYVDTSLRPVAIGAIMTAPPGAPHSNQTGMPTSLQGFQQTPPAMPVVLDPLMVAYNVSVPNTQNQAFTGANNSTQTAVSTFPYCLRNGQFAGGSPEQSAPKIPRVTVRDVALPTPPFGNTATVRPIPVGVADRLFRSTDDVAFNVIAANETLGAQTLNAGPIASIEYITRSGSYVSRASHGDYSWFAVLSPDYSETWGAPGGYPGQPSNVMFQGNASNNRAYNVAVVVCYQRDLRTLTNASTIASEYDRGERMCWVDFLGRGEVRLRVRNVNDQRQAQQLTDVRPNQWIMVCGQTGNGNPTANFMPMPALSPQMRGKPWVQTTARWYRVMSVSTQAVSDMGSPTTWYRSARVTGPDWTLNGVNSMQNMFYDDANQFQYADLSNATMPDPPTGWGTIVRGAIAVYEKTVDLDDSSAFSY